MKVFIAQLCPTLCSSVDCSPPGFSAHGILQTRILEWVAMPFFRGYSKPRDWVQVSWIVGRFFTVWATSTTCKIFESAWPIAVVHNSYIFVQLDNWNVNAFLFSKVLIILKDNKVVFVLFVEPNKVQVIKKLNTNNSSTILLNHYFCLLN